MTVVRMKQPYLWDGGFLTCAINHLRSQGLDQVRDLETLEKTIKGMEFKAVAVYVGSDEFVFA